MKSYKDWMNEIPKGFKSDGCTSSPDMNFRPCCILHDYLIRSRKVSRHAADTILRECIKDKKGPIIAWIYFLGVRTHAILGTWTAPAVAISIGALALYLYSVS